MPDPASKVRPPLKRSASLRPMIAPGPGLQSVGLPEPKVHTICPSGATSTTRLLNWSEMNMLPGAVKRSEEHTTELQSPDHLVCRLLLAIKIVYHNRERERTGCIDQHYGALQVLRA